MKQAEKNEKRAGDKASQSAQSVPFTQSPTDVLEPKAGTLPIYRLLLPCPRLESSCHETQEPILSPLETPGSPEKSKRLRLFHSTPPQQKPTAC